MNCLWCLWILLVVFSWWLNFGSSEVASFGAPEAKQNDSRYSLPAPVIYSYNQELERFNLQADFFIHLDILHWKHPSIISKDVRRYRRLQ